MSLDWQPLHDLIRSHQRFVLTSHVRPDADAIGSEMGLAAHLRRLGKDVRIINPSETPPHLRFLDPDRVVKKIGAEVTPASARDTDVHIVVDTSAWVQLGDVADVLRDTPARKVVIDHHLSSDDLGAEVFRDVSCSATGVLIAELVQAEGGQFDPVQADALYAAIATDTGWFRFPNTDPRTLRTAAALIEQGAQPPRLYRELYERGTLARLKLHSLGLARMQVGCGGRLAWTWVVREDFRVTGSIPSDTEELVNTGLSIEGVDAAFLLVEQPDGRVKASLRSRSELSVAEIAALHGGGGHRQAAGVLLAGPAEAAQQVLVEEFSRRLA